MRPPASVAITIVVAFGVPRSGIAKHASPPWRTTAQPAGGGARERDRHDRARAVLEQQQLDRDQHRRDRRAEDRRHAGRGAGGEQRLAFCALTWMS